MSLPHSILHPLYGKSGTSNDIRDVDAMQLQLVMDRWPQPGSSRPLGGNFHPLLLPSKFTRISCRWGIPRILGILGPWKGCKNPWNIWTSEPTKKVQPLPLWIGEISNKVDLIYNDHDTWATDSNILAGYFPLKYCLFDDGILILWFMIKSPHNSVGFHPLFFPKQPWVLLFAAHMAKIMALVKDMLVPWVKTSHLHYILILFLFHSTGLG